MEIYVLNNKCETLGVIDYCKSIIWTHRYYDCGDFELYLPVTSKELELFKIENYVTYQTSKFNVGIITSVLLETDEEEGDHLTIKGYSIDFVLGRRIVWNQTMLSGTVTACVMQLLTLNAFEPDMPERKLEGFTSGNSCDCDIRMQKQLSGDNLLTAIQEILHTYKFGYRMVYRNGKFRFDIYSGVDRSYQQSKNPSVVFSPEYDNLITSSYSADVTEYKNIALVAGEGEGAARRKYAIGNVSGLDRREMFVDARDISSDTDSGKISDDQYNALLIEKGTDELASAVKKELFDGTIEPEINYVFGQDYNLGDIVQVINKYGIGAPARITEVIECWDENGYSCIPTFASEEV